MIQIESKKIREWTSKRTDEDLMLIASRMGITINSVKRIFTTAKAPQWQINIIDSHFAGIGPESEYIDQIPFFSKSMDKIPLDAEQVERVAKFNTELLTNFVGLCPNHWAKDAPGVCKIDNVSYASKHRQQMKMHDHTKDLIKWINKCTNYPTPSK